LNTAVHDAAPPAGRRILSLASRLALGACFLAACSLGQVGSATPAATSAPVADPTASRQPTAPTLTSAPSPTPLPQAITLCLSAEPDSLYSFRAYTGRATYLAAEHVRQALFDGPIDSAGYTYRPVILETLPTLENGGATVESVSVKTGERYYDAATGSVTEWREGETQMQHLTMTYTLLPGLQWSDGEPLTADDSVFAFELLAGVGADLTMQPAALLALAQRTASYVALGDLTVRWTGLPGYLERAPLDTFDTFISPLPRHLLGDHDPSQMPADPDAARQPIGWGPYVLADWTPGESITVTRNPLYFRAAEGLPLAETIIFRFVPEATEALSALGRGECDAVLHDSFGLQQADLIPSIDAAANQGTLAAQYQLDTAWEHLDFDVSPLSERPAFFADPAVRQAAAQCLDRQALAEAVYPGHGAAAAGLVPPASPYFLPEAPDLAPYDPGAGRAALAGAGWSQGGSGPAEKDGTPLQVELILPEGQPGQSIAPLIAQNLAACGIEATPRFATPEEISGVGAVSPLYHRDYDLAVFAWRGGPGGAPPCGLYTTAEIPGDETSWLGNNITGYSNPEYDAACAEALGANPAEASRAAQLQAQRLLLRDLPSLPLFPRLQWLVARPELRGLSLDGIAVDELRSELTDIETLSLASSP
jgi:peptide/nickel transport system substrate-binding protein